MDPNWQMAAPRITHIDVGQSRCPDARPSGPQKAAGLRVMTPAKPTQARLGTLWVRQSTCLGTVRQRRTRFVQDLRVKPKRNTWTSTYASNSCLYLPERDPPDRRGPGPAQSAFTLAPTSIWRRRETQQRLLGTLRVRQGPFGGEGEAFVEEQVRSSASSR